MYYHPLRADWSWSSPHCDETISMRCFTVPDIVTSTKDPSYPLWCALARQCPSGALSFCPSGLVPGRIASERIQQRTLGVSPPRCHAGLRRICKESVVRLRPEVRSLLVAQLAKPMHTRPRRPFLEFLLSTFFTALEDMFVPLTGFHRPRMIAFVPTLYFAISIHQGVSGGQ